MSIIKGMELLGLNVRDKVTGCVGVVSSISYDLYGCIQAVLTPKANKEGGIPALRWYDICRLEILSKKPVLPVPTYGAVVKGPAEKPSLQKP